MIVECFGLPGVGKTTVCEQLTKTKGFVGVPKIVAKHRSLLFFMSYPLFSIAWLVRVCKEGVRANSYKLFRFKLSVFLNTVARVQYAQYLEKTGDDVVVLDEGLLQRALSVYEKKIAALDMKKLIQTIPYRSKVIYITNDRHALRGGKLGHARSSINAKYAEEWCSIMNHNYDSMVAAVEEAAVRYDNTAGGVRVSELISQLK